MTAPTQDMYFARCGGCVGFHELVVESAAMSYLIKTLRIVPEND